MPTKKPETIDAYLATVPETHRAGLKKLRSQIKKLYPRATEHISYGMPLFKLDGHPLAGFRAAKEHSAIFVWSGTALKTLGTLLKNYDTGMGTVRFPPNKLFPEKILKAILAARAREIKARWGKK
ncbi:MAG: DUF1801 domain-containing protein [Patescibacteria group bacterium]